MKRNSKKTARFASPIDSRANVTQSQLKAAGSNGGRTVVPFISKRDRFESSHPLPLLAKGQSSEAVYIYAIQQPITVTPPRVHHLCCPHTGPNACG